MTKNQRAILDLTRAMTDLTGNLPSLPGIYPDYAAPIVRNGQGGRELAMARWGMPTPAKLLEGKKVDKGVTNVRTTTSPHWQRWLGVENRCLVPMTAFSEPGPGAKGPITWTWFALDDDQPLAFMAGIWTTWTSVRKVKEGEVRTDLFAFLTTTPNAEVAPIHPKAMPVILTKPEEWDAWLSAPVDDALQLQRPLPDGSLQTIPMPPGAVF